MSYNENKDNLEAYFYAQKCMEILELKNAVSNSSSTGADLEKFLDELLNVKRKYMQKKTDSFNVFWMLNLAFSEKAHSAFIGDLLNPRGLHGKGDVFLKLFCDKMKISTPSNTYKLLEYPFSLEKRKNGRLDIFLPCNEDSSHEIIIENKVNASDQKKQLKKYHDFRPKARLFYLTLDGRKASKKSTDGNNGYYTPISYKKDILEWLTCCKGKRDLNKDCDILNLIEQYENIVKMLTGANVQKEESDEVKKVFEEHKISMDCLKENSSDFEKKFEKYIEDSFINAAKLAEAEVKEKGVIGTGGRIVEKYGGVSFRFGEWDDYVVRLEFQENKYQKIFYGVRFIGEKNENNDISENLKNAFKGYFDQKNEVDNGSSFLVGASWLRYQNWNFDCYLRVLDGSFERDLVEFIENIKWYMRAYIPEKR